MQWESGKSFPVGKPRAPFCRPYGALVWIHAGQWERNCYHFAVPDREDFTVGRVRFVGEQDGKPERELKRELCALFSRHAVVEKAYLARVSYDREGEPTVALCLAGCPTDALLVELQNLFHGMFRASEQLDIMFLSRGQELEIRNVVSAFFVRQ